MAERKRMVKRIVLWLLTVGCMTMIFVFSAQPAADSKDLSNGLLCRILEFFNLHLQADALELGDFLIRKAAHFSVYALLGVLVYLLLHSGYRIRRVTAFAGAFALSAMYAATDELHQLFVAGRSGQVSDVILDSAGAFVGIALAAAMYAFFERRRKK